MTEASIEPFAHAHLDGLTALVAAEGWTEYTEDAERTARVLRAPGVTTLVALADGRVVGAIQVQSDGVIQAHVSMLLIHREWRGRQLGAGLLREGLKRAGGLWIDIRTRTEGYYERLGASRSLGFRLTREDLGLAATATDEIGATRPPPSGVLSEPPQRLRALLLSARKGAALAMAAPRNTPGPAVRSRRCAG
jgi:GNAT superfamily N-acetyltransferase